MAIPASLAMTITEVHGAAGVAWLQSAPDLISQARHRWQIELQEPFQNLTYNFVAPATRADGTKVVLKAGVPGKELRSEIAALNIYAGQGAVTLLDVDSETGLLLLERLEPGRMLSALVDDDNATVAACQVMQRLWRPAANLSFPSLRDWTAGIERIRPHFGGGQGPFDADQLDLAERRRAELLASEPPAMLLHGDLHHFNILSGQREPWLAIDPKGVTGDIAFETAAFLINPNLQPTAALRRRVDILCDHLPLDRERVVGWAQVFGVLSAWWNFEDHGSLDKNALEFARRFADMR